MKPSGHEHLGLTLVRAPPPLQVSASLLSPSRVVIDGL